MFVELVANIHNNRIGNYSNYMKIISHWGKGLQS